MRLKITEEMYAAIPTLLAEGKNRRDIAAMYGVTPGTLWVVCSRRRISLRREGYHTPRERVTLTDEGLPGLSITKDVLKSLREAARAMDRPTTRLISDLLEKIASDGRWTRPRDDLASAGLGAW